MVDVTEMPSNSFGYVPTPALVAPIEFTMRLSDYVALGGHADQVRPVDEVLSGNHMSEGMRRVGPSGQSDDPMARHHFRWPGDATP